MALVSVSILNGDLSHLAQVADTIADADADLLHYDVMDGNFVDNLSFGLPVLSSLKPHVRVPVDVHLMIREPLRYAERFVRAGADLLSFHIESDSDPAETVREIHRLGIHAGIAVSPETPAESVFPLLGILEPDDFILMMTVHPGLGGQQFMPEVLPKIRTLRRRMEAEQLPLHIEVDGGINEVTGAACREAGADYLVAGSFVLCTEDPAAAVRALKKPL
ncbi:MAG: ribulose-phosphate 3-epimerase [Oscillospiraceae bacterium]|nr:ribulose-phosphate 3-epimerase [Oscillospiraceae bacterium]